MGTVKVAVISIHFCLSECSALTFTQPWSTRAVWFSAGSTPAHTQDTHSPLDPLHHVCYQFVRDAWAGLLGQAEGVLQLLHGSHIASSLLVLIFELQSRNRPLGPHFVAERTGQEVQH